MKKKLLYFTAVLTIATLATGCGKTEENKKSSINLEKGKFSIVCTSSSKDSIMETKTETTYNFNEDQYVINYATVTTEKFKDKSSYKSYKESQEESVKSSTDTVIYDLQKDDAKKTLIFTMAVTNIDVNDAETEEEKETLKASTILKSSEDASDNKTTCELKGITRSEIE